MPLISLGDVNLYDETQGEGQELVMINGYADHVGHLSHISGGLNVSNSHLCSMSGIMYSWEKGEATE